MKVRIKHTDKIIDVEWNMFGWLFDSPEGKRIFNTEELDFLDSDNIDWQSFRVETAKDILCSMIQDGYYGEDIIAHQSELAVGYANELCKQLKEKEEK